MPPSAPVDDDAPLRTSLQRALERRGFRVFAAESLKEGYNLAHSIKPEYAVIDLRLEDGSGIELVKRLREIHPKVPDRDPDRLRQHRHRGGGGEGRVRSTIWPSRPTPTT